MAAELLRPDAEKFQRLGIMVSRAVEMTGEPELADGVKTDGQLTDRRVANRQLAQTEEQPNCDLSDRDWRGHELTETEDEGSAELGDGDSANRELADRDHALGHPQLAACVAAGRDMDQGEAEQFGLGLPFETRSLF